jgi:hypothetical protein
VFRFEAGRDRVGDFQDSSDTLAFDDALWGGGVRTASQIMSYAHLESGAVVFDFGQGNVVVVDGVSSLDALADDVTWFWDARARLTAADERSVPGDPSAHDRPDGVRRQGWLASLKARGRTGWPRVPLIDAVEEPPPELRLGRAAVARQGHGGVSDGAGADPPRVQLGAACAGRAPAAAARPSAFDLPWLRAELASCSLTGPPRPTLR